jgi:hypothetical protein
MKKAWEWTKKWGGLLFGTIAAVLLLLLGGGWLWRKKKAEVGALKDELAVSEATKEIERLRALRKGVAERVGEKDQAIDEIDAELADNQRKIVEAHEGGEDLSAEEIAAEFARLGY